MTERRQNGRENAKREKSSVQLCFSNDEVHHLSLNVPIKINSQQHATASSLDKRLDSKKNPYCARNDVLHYDGGHG